MDATKINWLEGEKIIKFFYNNSVGRGKNLLLKFLIPMALMKQEIVEEAIYIRNRRP